jgi:amino acid adenylation domain-containing protein
MPSKTKSAFSISIRHTNPIMRDHRIHGVSVLPGVALLDTLYRLGKKLVGHSGFELQNIVFLEAIATHADFHQHVEFQFEQRDSGGWRVEIRSQRVFDESALRSQWVLNATCVLAVLAQLEPSEPAELDPMQFIGSADSQWSMEAFYQVARTLEIFHGPFMKTRGVAYRRGNEELIELALGDSAERCRDRFYAHPALLDGATFAGTSVRLLGGAAAAMDVPYIPLSIKRFLVRKELPAKIYVHSTSSPAARGDDNQQVPEVLSTDIVIYDPNGHELARFESLTSKRVRKAQLIEDLVRVESKALQPGAASTRLQLHEESQFSSAHADAGGGDVLSSIQQYLCGQIGKALGVSAKDIGMDTGFYELGMDSTLMLAVVRQLEDLCGHEFYPTLLFEYRTVAEIARFLDKEESRHFSRLGVKRNAQEAVDDRGHSSTMKTKPHPGGDGERSGDREANREAILGSSCAIPRESDIAVIGMAGRYPGASTLRAFWNIVRHGIDCVTEVPLDHWDASAVYREEKDAGLKHSNSTSKWGGFVEGVYQFDPLFFNMSPREAEGTDPQLRLILQVAWHALEDAGYGQIAAKPSNTAVYMGVMNDDFTWLAAERYAQSGEYAMAGSYAHELANRVSYQLNLQGPSVAIESACASSMTAIHMARRALLAGECDMAIAGGVNLSLHRSKYIMLSRMNMISPHGRERTFDAAADGYVPAEGVGVVVLKRLRNALADGDVVYGVLSGSAINHSGKGVGRFAPNPDAMVGAIRNALSEAGVPGSSVDYVETHGTGTVLGDSIEVGALSKALAMDGRRATRCALGSKANLGHLESASGICSVTKVLLSIGHGRIPRCPNVDNVNPGLRLENSDLYIPAQETEWKSKPAERIAGVHSFGVGGSNGFLVIRGIEPRRIVAEAHGRGEVFVVSAKTVSALRKYVVALRSYLSADKTSDYSLGNLAYTFQIGREAMTYRLAAVVTSELELIENLEGYLSGTTVASHLFCNHDRTGRLLDKSGAGGNPTRRLQSAGSHPLADAAEGWVFGDGYAWGALHENRDLYRISAPTYPFETNEFHLPEAVAMPGPIYPGAAPPLQSSSGESETVCAVPRWEECPSAHIEEGYDETETTLAVIAGLATPDANAIASAVGMSVQILSIPDSSNLAKQTYELFEQVIGLTRSLILARSGARKRIICVVAQSPGGMLHAPLAALFKTARLEHPTFRGSVVEVTPTIDEEEMIGVLAAERRQSTDATEIRYIQPGIREVRRLVEVSFADIAASRSERVRPGGVYWITGGLGKLGLVVGRLLCETKGVRLVLTGRSRVDREAIDAIAKLEESGATVRYIQCDVEKREDIARTAETIKASFGEINGIVHAAGVTADATILRKTSEQVRLVFAAKVDGILNIDDVTQDQDLDFLMLFSSASALLGNVGQADYAGANAFLDAFATFRNSLSKSGKRRGRTVSISWPLWKEGGLGIDEKTVALLYRHCGMLPMATDAGLRLFNCALGGSYAHVFGMYGDARRIRKFLWESPTASEVDAMSRESTGTQTEDSELMAKTIRYLSAIVSRILKLPLSQVDARVTFDKYGLDSILMIEFVKELGMSFTGVPSTIVFEYLTIEELARYFAGKYEPTLRAIVGMPADAGSFNPPLVTVPNHILSSSRQSILMQKPGAPQARAIAVSDSRKKSGDIAIVGVDGRYPLANDLSEFWRNLHDGRNCISEVPEERWDHRKYYEPSKDVAGATYSKWGGFIEGVDLFDPLFFEISRAQAQLMDPQQRLFLETVWNVLESAGYTRSQLRAHRVGVFVGSMYDHYPLVPDDRKVGEFIASSTAWSIANRVSYFFGFQGPSMAVNTACSSSLTAIHLACSSIRQEECHMAIAGGINLNLHPSKWVVLSFAGMIGSSGTSKGFGDGDGYIPGEGVGCLLLKSLADAMRDGDHIYGIIKGSFVNHGGRTSGFTVPNPHAQSDLVTEALRRAEVPPESIGYIEAAANGSAIGDAIEIAGLADAFKGSGRSKDDKIPIGTVKSNIGHLEAASGISQVTKVLLQFRHRQLAPSIHASPLNPLIDLQSTPFRIQQDAEPWHNRYIEVNGKRSKVPLRAMVSSFGVGGSNAHLVLEEFVAEDRDDTAASLGNGQWLIMVSAKSVPALRDNARQLAGFLADAQSADVSLLEMAYTLHIGREPMDERLAIVAVSKHDLSIKLDLYIRMSAESSLAAEGIFTASAGHGTPPELKLLADADVVRHITQDCMSGGNLTKLALLWVHDLATPGVEMYAGRSVKKVALPTYAFQKIRCWVDEAGSSAKAVGDRENAARPPERAADGPVPVDSKNDVVIVGAGISGLVAGCYLQQQGRSVLILEQHRVAGGYLQNYVRRGYDVEAVAALYPFVKQDEIIGRAFAELGLEVKWVECPAVVVSVSNRGELSNISGGASRDADQETNAFNIFKRYTPGHEDKLARMLRVLFDDEEIMDNLEHYEQLTFGEFLSAFLPADFHRYFYLPFANPTNPPEKTAFIAYRMVYKMYVGNAVQYYPKGGSKFVIESLVNKFVALGGRINLRESVLEMSVDGDQIVAVRTAKSRYESSQYVLACSPRALFESAVNLSGERVSGAYIDKVLRMEPCMPSCALTLYFKGGLEQWLDCEDLSRLHGMYIFDFDDRRSGVDPVEITYLYCLSPTRLNAALGERGDYVVAVAEVPYVSEEFWRSKKDSVAATFLRLFLRCFPKLDGHIDRYEFATPLTMEKFTRNYRGAISGWAMSTEQAGRHRLPQTTPWKNLFLAGHWTFPGPRIAMCVESARMVARILAAHRKVERAPAPTGDPQRETVIEFMGATIGHKLEDKALAKNLLEYGIDSILGLQLIRQMEERFKIRIKARELVECRSIGALVDRVVERIGSTCAGRGAEHLATVTESEGVRSALTQVQVRRYPLSQGQQGLWMLQRMAPAMSAYNVPLILRFANFNVAAFSESCRYVQRQMPTLRTVIEEAEGQAFQYIAHEVNFEFEEEDIGHLEPNERRQFLEVKSKRPFLLSGDALMRVGAYYYDSGCTALITIHHIIFDGVSIALFLKAFRSAYDEFVQGRRPPLLEHKAAYADFVSWELGMLAGDEGRASLRYWEQQLAGTLPQLALPLDRPRGAATSFSGATCEQKLGSNAFSGLKRVATAEGVSVPMMLLTLVKVLLYHYTEQEDMIVGMSTIGRPERRFDDEIGYFVNMIPIRGRVMPDLSFCDLARSIQLIVLDGLDHASYPFPRLVRELNVKRDAGISPIFQVMFSYQNITRSVSLGGIGEEENGIHQEGEFDLSFETLESRDDLLINVKYRPELFSGTTIKAMLRHYTRLVDEVTQQPARAIGAFDLLDAQDKDRVVREWNGVHKERGVNLCAHELFERQVARAPQNPAVIFQGEVYTYAELNEEANRLAHYLKEQGVGPEVLVGVCLERSADMLVGILAVMKAGGAYVPIDPNYPKARIERMIADARFAVLLTDAAAQAQMPLLELKVFPLDREMREVVLRDYAADNLRADAVGLDPGNLAYVIYTSGSTGNPKGVMITHSGLANYVDHAIAEYLHDKLVGAVVSTPLSFDATLTTILVPICAGLAVNILPERGAQTLDSLRDLLLSESPLLFKITPAHLAALMSDESKLKSCAAPHVIVIGGEQLSGATLKPWKERLLPRATYINEYGPTEAVVGCSTYEVSDRHNQTPDWERPIPIGRPIANTELYVMNRAMKLQLVGCIGELYIGGAGLARGYLNDERLTRERFIENCPCGDGGRRLYKTGDLVRWLRSGQLEYVGRADDQVKIRGFRVELGEIENALGLHAGVSESKVLAKSIHQNTQLVAYWVASESGRTCTSDDLKRHLSNILPAYMVPSAFIELAEIPLTSNGKVDVVELANTDARYLEERSYTPATNEIERILVGIWEQVLGVEKVGTGDNYFELGGDSILSIQLVSKAQAEGLNFGVQEVFQYQTIQHLAQALAAESKLQSLTDLSKVSVAEYETITF